DARPLFFALAHLLPRRDDNLVLPARDLVSLAAAATATAAAGLARLREAPLERLDLDEIQVALRRPAAVFRNDVVRDQIARLEGRLGRLRFGRLVGRVGLRLVELTAELRDAEAVAIEYGRGRAARTAALGTRGLTQLLEIKELVLRDRPAILAERHGHRPPLAAVDRVTQLDVLKAEVVARLDPQRDL